MFEPLKPTSDGYSFYFCQANDAFVDGRPLKALSFLDDAEKEMHEEYCVNEIKEARKVILASV